MGNHFESQNETRAFSAQLEHFTGGAPPGHQTGPGPDTRLHATGTAPLPGFQIAIKTPRLGLNFHYLEQEHAAKAQEKTTENTQAAPRANWPNIAKNVIF